MDVHIAAIEYTLPRQSMTLDELARDGGDEDNRVQRGDTEGNGDARRLSRCSDTSERRRVAAWRQGLALLSSSGGLRPPDPLTRSLAGTPMPRSARVAHSLPLVRSADSALVIYESGV